MTLWWGFRHMPTGQLIKIRCQDEQKRLGPVRNTLPCTLRSSQFPVTHTVVKQRGQRAMNPVWAIMTSMLFNHHVLSHMWPPCFSTIMFLVYTLTCWRCWIRFLNICYSIRLIFVCRSIRKGGWAGVRCRLRVSDVWYSSQRSSKGSFSLPIYVSKMH